MRYRSKPSEIEAIQWTGPDAEDDLIDGFLGFLPHDQLPEVIRFDGSDLELRAGKEGAQGWVPVPVGHWIVRQTGDLTDHWPVDPDYFAAKYERVCQHNGVPSTCVWCDADDSPEPAVDLIEATCDPVDGVRHALDPTRCPGDCRRCTGCARCTAPA